MKRPGVAAALAAVLLVVATSCQGSGGEAIPPPPTTLVSVTSPPDPPDLEGVAIAEVKGRTTTTCVALTPGRAALSGQVVGPDGPVAGATVRVERIVADAIGSLEVITNEDGTWQAPPPADPPAPIDPAAPPTRVTTTLAPLAPQGLLGGRYRVRAWRAPDLSLTAPTLLFLGGTENKQLAIQLSRYSGLAVTSSVAPNPPIVDELVNIAVLVTTRSVDPAGIVRSLGVPGAAVSLLGGRGWQVVREDSDTDEGGRASFQLRCREEGPQPLGVTVNGNTSFTLQVPACALAPPSTTVAPPPDDTGTTEPEPDPSSTSSSSSAPPRSTTSTSRATTTSTRPTPTTV